MFLGGIEFVLGLVAGLVLLVLAIRMFRWLMHVLMAFCHSQRAWIVFLYLLAAAIVLSIVWGKLS